MKIKTSELAGCALDWAVAKCEGFTMVPKHNGWEFVAKDGTRFNGCFEPTWTPSANWSQGGPIIEWESLCVGRKHQADTNYCEVNNPAVDCWARTTAGGYLSYGPTPLIAAMRCYVASKLGDEVEVPEGLT